MPTTTGDFFTDDESSIHEQHQPTGYRSASPADAPRIDTAPTRTVRETRWRRSYHPPFKLPAATTDYFTDDESSIHESNINRLAKSGITGGCSPGRYCPAAFVTRGQMAAFLHRALT